MPYSQHTLFRGRIVTLENSRAFVELSSVGASINRFVVDGHDYIVRSSLEEPIFGYRGAIIAPWPNRLGDGTYTFDGDEYQVPITEHDRNTALHGLVSFQDFNIGSKDGHSVEFIHRIVPTTGYPFPLEIRARYTLDDTTLTTRVNAINLGLKDAPYGVCCHPYFIAGPEPLDEWTFSLPAGSVLDVDERLLPTGLLDIEEQPDLDFREPRPIGDVHIDHAYTQLSSGSIRLESASGRAISMEFDAEDLPWVQVHTADHPDLEKNRAGLAVEPMTCPPDAFRTGTNLIRIKAGSSHSVKWDIVAHPAS